MTKKRPFGSFSISENTLVDEDEPFAHKVTAEPANDMLRMRNDDIVCAPEPSIGVGQDTLSRAGHADEHRRGSDHSAAVLKPVCHPVKKPLKQPLITTTYVVEDNPKSGKWRSGCLWLLAGLFGLVLVGALFGPKNPQPRDNTKPAESDAGEIVKARDDGDDAALYLAQNIIRQSLKDPGSAEFSEGYGRIKNGKRVACGRVNGRNSFGALAGAQRWLVIADQNIAMVKAFDNRRTFSRLWNEYCAGLDDRDKPMPAELFGIRFGSTSNTSRSI